MKYDNDERENGWHSEEDECIKNSVLAGYSFVQIEKRLKALNAENERPYRSYNAIRMRASRKLQIRRFKK